MNQGQYRYVFSNFESHLMTPIEAHKYAHRKKIDIVEGPNYSGGKQKLKFNGWGYHEGLKMTFRGPAHYREYLRQNNLIEAGNEPPPIYEEYDPPIWTPELLKKASDYGIEIGSVLAEALLSGEAHWPDQV